MSNEQNQAALAEAWSGTVTPYSQIKENLNPDPGQYDFTVGKLEPQLDRNGMYCIVGEFKITSPASCSQGPGSTYKRTLYVGTKKDNLAKLPETRLNSPGLRFLKSIARVSQVPLEDQSDAKLCSSLLGKAFGCRIEETKYNDQHGNEKKGTDFGRNVTPAGTIPTRLDREPVANGAAGAATMAPASPEVAGATFGSE